MRKQLIALAAILCVSLPAMSQAATWKLGVKVATVGGNLAVRGATPLTFANGTVYYNYTTSAANPNKVGVTVAATNGCYGIQKVTVNSSNILNPASPYNTPDYTPANGASQMAIAYFYAKALTVSAAVASNGGGTVSPSSTATFTCGTTPSSALVYNFIPNAGGSVTGIANLPTGSVLTGASFGTTDGVVTVTISKAALAALTAPVSMVATFSGVKANAGYLQTAIPAQLVRLVGTATPSDGSTTYSWVPAAGNPSAVTLATPNSATASFNAPATVGTYSFVLTVNGSVQATTKVVVADTAIQAATNMCADCHANSGMNTTIASNWAASIHGQSTHSVCSACHVGTADAAHPGTVNNDTVNSTTFRTTVAGVNGFLANGAVFCTTCHTGSYPIPHVVPVPNKTCVACHTPTGTGDAHSIAALDTMTVAGCVDCHSLQQPLAKAALVNDNSGVRSIMTEFSKRSHHITGGTPTNAQCVVCHLEGKVVGAGIAIDSTKHMVDAKIHLRNADDNSDMQWSGTEHGVMDNFCFSCHDTDGALAVPATFAGVTGFSGTASNPFGDTLTNGYDQVARAGVVDVKTAFTTTNASHHAVSGQKYQYRFSTAANAAVWVARDPANRTMPAASEIAEGHLDADGIAIDFDAAETMEGDFSFDSVSMQPATGPGTLPKGEGEATLYEAEKFVSTYIPLGATLSVADNSTLHCGDCHTVGQWKANGPSTNADGSLTSVAIGAHGSANEYLLRNSLGTDALHNNLTYVCFNCHKAGLNVGAIATNTLGFGNLHPVSHKNQVLGYATTHAVSAFHIQCLADSANNIGATNRLAKSWEADKTTLDYAPLVTGGAVLPAGGSDAGSGNITGIACTSCHNSALRSGFGGIHGGDNTYVDGFNRTQKSYRFMPGMGNYRYAPPGGWDGKDTSVVAPVGSAAAGKPVGGCYTNGDPSKGSTDTNAGYSSCSHHGTAVAPTGSPTATGGSAPVLGGGTAKAPFTDPAAEYTVREATAGNALVTRPLKY